MIAQCSNARLDIFATYSVSESSSFVLKIAGGFDAKVYQSQRFKFHVTLQRVPDPLVTSFKIDFGNGQSQTLTFAQADLPIMRTFDVDYTSLSDKLIRVSTLPGTASLEQTLKISTLRAISSPIYRTPTRTQLITGASFSPTCQGFLPTAKDGQSGAASIYMHTLLSPSNPTGRVRRPLIFLEGIDFGTTTRCDPNLSGPDKTVGVGDFGWDNFITGLFEDPDDLDNETFGQINPLVQRMLNDGYDIVFCDFADGADWIQKNGLAFIAVVNSINAEKKAGTPVGTCFPNIVVGASMGGQVAKWALRTMEIQGINHDAALYVSFDSPQQGANVALSVQSFIWFNANYGSEESRASILPKWKSLNRPAAQQLLVHHFNQVEQTNGCDLRQQFAQVMTTLGYPRNTRNIATANGNGFGTGQGYSSSALLGNFRGTGRINKGISPIVINTDVVAADIKLFASGAPIITEVAKFSDAKLGLEVPKGSFYALDYLNLGVVPVPNSNRVNVLVRGTTQETYFNPIWGSNTQSFTLLSRTLTFKHDFRNWDNAPGGNRQDIARTLKKAVETSLMGQSFENLPTDVPAGTINAQTFIPTISALDIQTGVDNVNFNIASQLVTPTTLNAGVSPFAAVFFPTNNESHVQVSPQLGDFIIAQMNAAQVTLQSPLAEPYNYGLIRTIIPSVTIASGGILGINNNGRTAYVNRTTSEAAASKTVFETVATSACDANIVVQNGGQLQFGAGWNNAGILRIKAGSRLTLQNGSTTQVNNASQIIVESGGRLIIDGGANINLTGSESTIYVKSGGELVINGDMNFSGDGFFQFDAGHILTLGADLKLIGSGKTKRMIRLNPSPQNTFNKLTINGRAFNLSNALVEYGNNRCEINITNDNTQENAISDACFKGFGSGLALNFGNVSNANIQRCDFVNLTQGVNINSNSNLLEVVEIKRCNFNLVGNGISIISPNWTNIPKNRDVQISDCTFNYKVGQTIISGTACRLKNMLYNSDFTNNTFTGYREGNLFEDVTAIELQNSSMGLYGGIISDCKTGISAEKDVNNNVVICSIVGVSNPEIRNCETGINIVGGPSSRYSTFPYGTVELKCSRFINNLTGIKGSNVLFTNSGIMNSIGGNNTFQNLPNGLLFDICYPVNAVENIQASNNFWVGGFNSMRFNLRVKTIPQGVCQSGIRRLEQCSVLLTQPTNCNGNNGGWVPQSCCNRSIISSNGAGSIITGVPIVCLVGSTTTTKAMTSAEKTAIQSDVKLAEVSDDLVSIYPNPANQTVKLDIESGNYTLKVSNTVGQTIFTQNTEGSLSVDVSTWTNGIYLFEVTNKATNQRQRSKIVVQH